MLARYIADTDCINGLVCAKCSHIIMLGLFLFDFIQLYVLNDIHIVKHKLLLYIYIIDLWGKFRRATY